jgi:hypothetical protein
MNVPVYGENYRKMNADLQMLKVTAQSAPNMTVNVNPGSYWINGNTFYEFAGGTTTAIVNPTVGAYWVAVILVGSAIQLVYGQSSADTPVFPTLPTKSVPLAAIYVKAADTVVTSDMVFDIRPIFAAGGYPEKHNDLANRDAAECHPIDAITGLKDALAGKVSTEAMAQAIGKCAAFDGTKAKSFTLNSAETGSPSSDVYINVARGNQPAAALRYNEADNRWEFTDDGQSYKPFDSTIDIDPFNQDNYYVKADIDSKLVNVEKEIATKAEANIVSNLATTVANAATVDYVNNQFQNLYSKQAMDDIVAEIRKDASLMTNKANVGDAYIKAETDKLLAAKANVGDSYLKAEEDTKFLAKANVGDAYTKLEDDALLAKKADVDLVYSKDAVDKLLADKTSAPDVYKYVEAQLEVEGEKKQDKLAFTPENVANKNVVNGYAGLDANGKILIDQLPDSAKQGTHIVEDETARKALTGLISGERAYEIKTGDSYIFDGTEWKLVADADWANVKLDFANIENRPTTLAGYGITDAAVKADVDAALGLKAVKTDVETALGLKADVTSVYTKTDADNLLALKANAANVYTKTDADALLKNKANTVDVYTKTESEQALALKANSADVYTQDAANKLLATKADTTEVYSKQAADDLLKLKENAGVAYTKAESDAALALKANVADVYKKSEVDTALAAKANTTDVYAKTDVDSALALKAVKADVDSALALKAVKTDVDTALGLKANVADVYTKTEVDTAVAAKAVKADVNTALALKANTADVYAKADKLPGADIVLTSPNGTKYSITVSDAGALTATKIA